MGTRLDWDFSRAPRDRFEMPGPLDTRKRVETYVKNGDCLAACFCCALEAMARQHIRPDPVEEPARRLRNAIVARIQETWHDAPKLNASCKVHEIMAMAHDTGIPPAERDRNGHWPEDPEGRLAKYKALQKSFFLCDAEMLIFAEMMYERNTPVLLRVWREDATHPNLGVLIHTVPEPSALHALGVSRAVVIDLFHTGVLDSRQAHYKLLDSGSLQDLVTVSHTPRSATKRARSEVSLPDL